jgi:hypothetical protein
MNAVSRLVTLDRLTLHLWLMTAQCPSDQEWEANFVEVNAYKKARLGDLSALRVLVISDGGRPNAKQRVMASMDIKGRPVKKAVLSPQMRNPLHRGALTAMRWLNPGYKGFEPSQVLTALEYLDLGSFARPIAVELTSLEPKLPPVPSMRVVKSCLLRGQIHAAAQ